MPKRTTSTPREPEPENIIDIDVAQEMETSFLEYAYSVIYSRALPDGRDGLKPVQRRILFGMREMGLRPDRGHVKSQRIVGDVMGKYHPHGDSAIYDALVRMAQDFSLRLPLVDGHGNFGSLDDGPAASRYTEARPATAAPLLTDSLDEDVVDFYPNYDNQLMQPTVMPAAFPNLLVNGASGIAVGMATNMPPHNLSEVVEAAIHLLRHPRATVEDLMEFVPGPDLPTGGTIIGLDGVRDAYAGGRGTFKTRAKTTVENVTARRKGIVVTELPYMVGPEKVKEKIRDAVQAKKLQGISDVVDLTDRHHGLRLVIELKTGFNPEAVLEHLYRLTPMEESFGINNVCLVDGAPSTLGLKDLLSVFISHRLDVVTRRSQFRLRKHQDRLHLVDGLLLALLDIDRVIAIIRAADDSQAAKAELIAEFSLSDIQSEYILELKLRRLTKFSRIELETERAELQSAIDELEALLASDAKLRSLVAKELRAVVKEHATPRRTVLLEGGLPKATKSATPLEVADEPCYVMLSATGHLARTKSATQPAPPAPQSRTAHDVVTHIVATSARGTVGLVTSTGRLVRTPVVELPTLAASASAPSLAGGTPVDAFLELGKKERVVGLCSLAEDSPGLAVGTRNGLVKRLTTDYPNKDEFEVITLKAKDEVVSAVELASDDQHLVFITQAAQLLHFEASKVRPQGRTGGGIAGIKLGSDDHVVAFTATHTDDACVVTVAEPDNTLPGTAGLSAKVTPFEAFPAKGRATGGVRAHRLLKGEYGLCLAWAGQGPAIASNADGEAVRLPDVEPRRDGSGSPTSSTLKHIAGALETPAASDA